jgi:DNA-binding NtrC family response regulator
LKNITEQMSVLEQERLIRANTLQYYLPHEGFANKSMMVADKGGEPNLSERELLYKVLFDMKSDLTDLKKLVFGMMQSGANFTANPETSALFEKVFSGNNEAQVVNQSTAPVRSDIIHIPQAQPVHVAEQHIEVEETLSLSDTEKELIKKALQKHKNKRKYAAQELGISERTLYRKIKEYNLTKS